MKYIIGVQLIFSLFITEITFGQTVTNVPSDAGCLSFELTWAVNPVHF